MSVFHTKRWFILIAIVGFIIYLFRQYEYTQLTLYKIAPPLLEVTAPSGPFSASTEKEGKKTRTPYNITSELLPGHFFPSCHVHANERRIKIVQKERTEKDQPHFSSMLLSPSRYSNSTTTLHWTAIFNSIPQMWKNARPRERDLRWTNANWECDQKPAIVVGGGCPEGTGFAIQCPQGDKARISKITVYPLNYSLASKLTYRIGEHVACELDYPLRIPQKGTNVVGTVYIFGGLARSPHHLLEWIEYHRFVGVGHFYVYIVDRYSDDEWNVLPNLPYITYIPWDMITTRSLKARAEILSFQIAQQTDVLYRSRAAAVEWVTYNDIDEYIQVMGGKEVLELDRFVERNPELGSLMGLTIMYGSKETIEKVPDFVIEYSYRAVEPNRIARQKCLVRPGFVDHYNNHHVSLGNETMRVKPFNHWRYNHYKKASSGVFVRQQVGNKDIMQDSSLSDSFLAQLKTRVDEVKKMMINANNGTVRKEWTYFDHLL